MPPVAVRVVEALAESQRVADELLRLALVHHLLLFGLALQLQHHKHTQRRFTLNRSAYDSGGLCLNLTEKTEGDAPAEYTASS